MLILLIDSPSKDGDAPQTTGARRPPAPTPRRRSEAAGLAPIRAAGSVSPDEARDASLVAVADEVTYHQRGLSNTPHFSQTFDSPDCRIRQKMQKFGQHCQFLLHLHLIRSPSLRSLGQEHEKTETSCGRKLGNALTHRTANEVPSRTNFGD